MRRRRFRLTTAERGDARAVVGGAIGRRVALDTSVRRHLSKPEQDVDVVGVAHGAIFRKTNIMQGVHLPPPPALEHNLYPPRLLRFTQLSVRVRRRHGPFNGL